LLETGISVHRPNHAGEKTVARPYRAGNLHSQSRGPQGSIGGHE
jgi:hypothetical protein